MLDAFKILHESGVVFNNLSTDHILIGDGDFTPGTRTLITLVDFSKAKFIISKDGQPIKDDGKIYKDQSKIKKLY